MPEVAHDEMIDTRGVPALKQDRTAVSQGGTRLFSAVSGTWLSRAP